MRKIATGVGVGRFERCCVVLGSALSVAGGSKAAESMGESCTNMAREQLLGGRGMGTVSGGLGQEVGVGL